MKNPASAHFVLMLTREDSIEILPISKDVEFCKNLYSEVEFYEIEEKINIKFHKDVDVALTNIKYINENLVIAISFELIIISCGNIRKVKLDSEIICFDVLQQSGLVIAVVVTVDGNFIFINLNEAKIIVSYQICKLLDINIEIQSVYFLEDGDVCPDICLLFKDLTGIIFISTPLNAILSQTNDETIKNILNNAQAIQFRKFLNICSLKKRVNYRRNLISLIQDDGNNDMIILSNDGLTDRIYWEIDSISNLYGPPKKVQFSYDSKYCLILLNNGQLLLGLFPQLIFFNSLDQFTTENFIISENNGNNINHIIICVGKFTSNEQMFIILVSIPSMEIVFKYSFNEKQSVSIFSLPMELSLNKFSFVLFEKDLENSCSLHVVHLSEITIDGRFEKLINRNDFINASNLAEKYNLDSTILNNKWLFTLLGKLKNIELWKQESSLKCYPSNGHEVFDQLMEVIAKVKITDDIILQLFDYMIPSIHCAIQWWICVRNLSTDISTTHHNYICEIIHFLNLILLISNHDLEDEYKYIEILLPYKIDSDYNIMLAIIDRLIQRNHHDLCITVFRYCCHKLTIDSLPESACVKFISIMFDVLSSGKLKWQFFIEFLKNDFLDWVLNKICNIGDSECNIKYISIDRFMYLIYSEIYQYIQQLVLSAKNITSMYIASEQCIAFSSCLFQSHCYIAGQSKQLCCTLDTKYEITSSQSLYFHRTFHSASISARIISTQNSFYWWNIFKSIEALEFKIETLTNLIISLYLINISISAIIELNEKYNIYIDLLVLKSSLSPSEFLIYLIRLIDDIEIIDNLFINFIHPFCVQYKLSTDDFQLEYFSNLPNIYELNPQQYIKEENKAVSLIKHISEENKFISALINILKWIKIPLSENMSTFININVIKYSYNIEFSTVYELHNVRCKLISYGFYSDLIMTYLNRNLNLVKKILSTFICRGLSSSSINIETLLEDIKIILSIYPNFDISEMYSILIKELIEYSTIFPTQKFTSILTSINSQSILFNVSIYILRYIKLKTLKSPFPNTNKHLLLYYASFLYCFVNKVITNPLMKHELLISYNVCKCNLVSNKIESIKHSIDYNHMSESELVDKLLHADREDPLIEIYISTKSSDLKFIKLIKEFIKKLYSKCSEAYLYDINTLKLFLNRIIQLVQKRIQFHSSSNNALLLHNIFNIFLNILNLTRFKTIPNSSHSYLTNNSHLIYSACSFLMSKHLLVFWDHNFQSILINAFYNLIQFHFDSKNLNLHDSIQTLINKLSTSNDHYDCILLCSSMNSCPFIKSNFNKSISDLLFMLHSESSYNKNDITLSLLSEYDSTNIVCTYEDFIQKINVQSVNNASLTGTYLSYLNQNKTLFELSISFYETSMWYKWTYIWDKDFSMTPLRNVTPAIALRLISSASKSGYLFQYPNYFDHYLLKQYCDSFNIDFLNALNIYTYGLIWNYCHINYTSYCPIQFINVLKYIKLLHTTTNDSHYKKQIEGMLFGLFFSIPSYCYSLLVYISAIICSLNGFTQDKQYSIILKLNNVEKRLLPFLYAYERIHESSTQELIIYQEQVEKAGSILSNSISSNIDVDSDKLSAHIKSTKYLPLTLLIGKTWEVLQEELDCLTYKKLIPLINILDLNSDYFLLCSILSTIKHLKTIESTTKKTNHKINLFSIPDNILWEKFKDLLENINDYSLSIRAATEIGQYFTLKQSNRSIYVNTILSDCLSNVFEWVHKKFKYIIQQINKNLIDDTTTSTTASSLISSSILKDATNQMISKKKENNDNLKKSYQDALLVWRVSKIEQILIENGISLSQLKTEIVDPSRLIQKIGESIESDSTEIQFITGSSFYKLSMSILSITSRMNLLEIWTSLLNNWLSMKSQNDEVIISKILKLLISIIIGEHENKINRTNLDDEALGGSLVKYESITTYSSKLISYLFDICGINPVNQTMNENTNFSFSSNLLVQKRALLSLITINSWFNYSALSFNSDEYSYISKSFPLLLTCFLTNNFVELLFLCGISINPLTYINQDKKQIIQTLITNDNNEINSLIYIIHCINDYSIYDNNLWKILITKICDKKFKISISFIKLLIKTFTYNINMSTTSFKLILPVWNIFKDNLIYNSRTDLSQQQPKQVSRNFIFLLSNCHYLLNIDISKLVSYYLENGCVLAGLILIFIQSFANKSCPEQNFKFNYNKLVETYDIESNFIENWNSFGIGLINKDNIYRLIN